MAQERLMSKKKPAFPVCKDLDAYLEQYNRKIEIPIFYEDLLRFAGSVVVYDNEGEDTLWVRAAGNRSEPEAGVFHPAFRWERPHLSVPQCGFRGLLHFWQFKTFPHPGSEHSQ